MRTCQGLRIPVGYIRPVLCAGLKLTDRYAESPRGERYSLRNVMVAAPRWAERAVHDFDASSDAGTGKPMKGVTH